MLVVCEISGLAGRAGCLLNVHAWRKWVTGVMNGFMRFMTNIMRCALEVIVRFCLGLYLFSRTFIFSFLVSGYNRHKGRANGLVKRGRKW